MRKDNTVNYNTEESELKSFADFNAATEKEELNNIKTSFSKNEGDVADLPNNNKLKFNKVTRTWQKVSKSDIDDSINALKESINVINKSNITKDDLEKIRKQLNIIIKNI